jgi:predicted  nucleic acid-binding Zn-ribbon protein
MTFFARALAASFVVSSGFMWHPHSALGKDYRLAHSQKMGVEVLVPQSDQNWCQPTLKLRLNVAQKAFIQRPAFHTFSQKLTALIQRECPSIRQISADIYQGDTQLLTTTLLQPAAAPSSHHFDMDAEPSANMPATDATDTDTADIDLTLLPPPEDLWNNTDSDFEDIIEERIAYNWEEITSHTDINSLLDDVVTILNDSKAEDLRAQLRQIQDEIKDHNEKIDEYNYKMASAPTKADTVDSILGAVLDFQIDPTKDQYRAWIKDEEDAIAGLEEDARGLQSQFAQTLNDMGVPISTSQVQGLLNTATMDDWVSLISVFENLKSINSMLAEQTIQSRESLEIARRYYGIYAAMLDVAIYMNVKFIHKVDTVYLANLNTITNETEKLLKETHQQIKSIRDKTLRQNLEHNARAQKLTLKAADKYRDHLQNQKTQVEQSLHKLRQQWAVAVNTYKTVTLSRDLVAMLRSSGKEFNALMQLDIPPLQPFENLEMQQEFNKLTNRITKPAG